MKGRKIKVSGKIREVEVRFNGLSDKRRTFVRN
jgi:hypothetical protein